MPESWKPIVGHEKYFISDYGNVYSITSNIFLKPMIDKDGYCTVKLNGKMRKIHRLVAMHFIPNPDMKPCVDHICNNKTDNRVTELRWVTHMENSRNKRKRNIFSSRHIGVCFKSRVQKWEANIKINYKQKYLGSFKNEDEAALAYNQYIVENNLTHFNLNII